MTNAIGNNVKEMVLNLEENFNEDLGKLLKDYGCKTRISYKFTLNGGTIDDSLEFMISLIQDSRTKKRVTFNCLSPTMIFQEQLIKGIAEIINSDADYDNLKELIEYSNLVHLNDFIIKDR